MADAEEPALQAERLFEQLRRFTDTWVSSSASHLASRRKAVDSAAPVPGPLRARLLEVQHRDARALFNTGNPAFNKLAALLVHLVERLREVQARLDGEACARLLAFGEEPQQPGGGSNEGVAQLALARALPTLLALADDLEALQQLLENLLLQLGALCVEYTRKPTVLQGSHATTAFLAAADSLASLLRVEIVCSRNMHLASAFALFTRMLGTVAVDAQGFQPEQQQAAADLQATVAGLQERLLGKGPFRRFAEARAARGTELALACGSPSFTAAAAGVLRARLTALTGKLAEGSELPGERESLLGAVALGALAFRQGADQGAFHRKLLRQLLDLHQQVPLLPVCGEHFLQPAAFLSQWLPASLDGYIPAAYARQAAVLRGEQLGAAVVAFGAQLQRSALGLAAWSCHLDLLMESSEVTESLLTRTAAALTQGLALAGRTRQRLLLLLGCLKLAGTPVPPATLRVLVQAACQVKAVEHAFQRHATAIAEALPHLVTHVRSGTQGLLAAMGAGVRAKSRQAASSQPLLASRAKRERTAAALQDAAVAIDAAHTLADGPVSSMQLSALATCLDAVETTGAVAEGELQRAREQIAAMRSLTRFHTALRQETDCSFLYCHRALLPAALKDLAARPAEARQLPLVMAAFADARLLLAAAPLEPAAACRAHDAECERALRKHLLLPLCDAVETALRLHYHACHVTGEPPPPQQDVTPLLRLEPLRLPSRTLHLRRAVEHELRRRFHNHAAVALHDWHTYAQLCLLAGELYGLWVVPPDLPGLVVDPGLDLVEVLRELPAFAAGYAYSLVSQSFTQRVDARTGTKHLAVLGPPQLAHALRRHGAGLAGAAVNAAYRLLARHVSLLSQWLFQDQVKSRLAKEVRSASEAVLGTSASGSSGYGYARAEALAGDLRRLGCLPSGLPYLDHLRCLVTEVGNALGLVRLVQQGRAAQQAAGAQFLRLEPGQPPPRFRAAVASDAGPEVAAAAAALDAAAARLAADAGAEPDYYAVLVRVFAERLAGDGGHTASLWAAVPALTLTAVEAALLAKEQLPQQRRRSQASAAFTDDGFALGLAFLLRVLGQEDQFGSLRWFEAVRSHFGEREGELRADAAAGGGVLSKLLGRLAGAADEADSRAQNRELARARLESYAGEFRLLEDAFGCARLLFFRK